MFKLCCHAAGLSCALRAWCLCRSRIGALVLLEPLTLFRLVCDPFGLVSPMSLTIMVWLAVELNLPGLAWSWRWHLVQLFASVSVRLLLSV